MGPDMVIQRIKRNKRHAYRYAASCLQGWPSYNEDRMVVSKKIVNHPGLLHYTFCAVFDGHGGHQSADFCAEKMLDVVLDSVDRNNPKISPEQVMQGLEKAFVAMDSKLKEKLASEDDHSGTTAVCALFNRKNIYLAHCGDSRALLSYIADEKPLYATRDHKPDDPDEKARIKAAGGFVVNHRINGILGVARALGDFDYKWNEGETDPDKQPVSCRPFIHHVKIGGNEEFLVLACDGIWDQMANEEVVAFLRHRRRCCKLMGDLSDQLVETCFFKGSRDNLTAIVVWFRFAENSEVHAYSRQAKLEDREVDADIERQVREMMVIKPGEADVELHEVLSELNGRDIQGLPPGGGLPSKRKMIQQFWQHAKDSDKEKVDDFV